MRPAILVIFLCLTFPLPAQLNGKYTFRHIDQTDGLLHTTIRGIGQDQRGFMWILTWNGLQRYDGSRFVNYPEIINRASFGVFHDSELYVDTLRNKIWVIRNDKIDQLDLNTNTISTIDLNDLLNKKHLHSAGSFTRQDRETWLIGEYGIIAFKPDSIIPYSAFFNTNAGQNHRNSYVIRNPATGDYWAHNFNHLYLADHQTRQIQTSSDALPEHPLLLQLKQQFGSTNKIRYIMMDSHRNLWISTWTERLLRYNFDSNVLFTYDLNHVFKKQKASPDDDNIILINAIYEDRQKNLWFATDFAGLLLYDHKQDHFNAITSDEKISNGLRYSFSIRSIFQDQEDNIWLGTDRGISIFNPSRNYFRTIRHIDGVEASLPKYDINDIIETAQGEILVATWGGGITIFDQDWNFIRHVHFDGPPALDQVWSFVQCEDGMIWAGTQQGYIHSYDPLRHTFSTTHPPETGNSTITTMAKDREGNIFMGLHNGRMALWNKSENRFYRYNDAGSALSLSSDPVFSVYIDPADRCWVTTSSGLLEFNKQRLAFTHLYRPESKGDFPGVTLQGIVALNDSTLLLGAVYAGLFLFNTHSGKFARPQIQDLPATTSVFALRKDDEGNIWFTTNFSIDKVSPDFSGHTRYNIGQSLINAALGSPRFSALRDGRWVTSSTAEIISFDPQKIGMVYDDPLQVEICAFSVFDKPVNMDSIEGQQGKLILPFDRNFISIEFSALTYTELRELNYYYRLSGINEKWIQSTGKPYAVYTDLKPGSYLFEVKADHGDQPSNITSLAFIITPPWWGTLWFRALALLAIGSLTYFVIRNRIKAIRKSSGLRQQIVETEMMALRSQMNPHFIFNCINSIDAMIQSNDKYRATVYLNKFARLIRNVLDSSKQNKIALSKDMETLQLYVDLELFRYLDKFTASIETDDELMQNDYKVPPLIIQPYVENAILHGLRHKKDKPGKLSITVVRKEEEIVYVVEDNGVGRKATNGDTQQEGKSYGMQISSDRIRLFNNEEIASVLITDLETAGKPSGTRVEVHLKIQ